MANSKISALTAATTPVAGTETLPIVQGGVTKQVSIANLTAGRAVSASSLTLTTPLSTANGGTGLSSFTANQVFYASSTSAVGQSTNFVFDGTNMSLGGVASPVARLQIGVSGSASGTQDVVLLTRYSSDTDQFRWLWNYSGTGYLGIGTSGTSMILGRSTGTTGAVGATYATIDSSGNITANIGNFVQGTAAKGINFTANTATAGSTSRLLNWYEEGTYTATLTPGTSGTITLNSNYDTLAYTRVGRLVTITGQIQVFSVSSPVGTYFYLNLPFTPADLTELAGRGGFMLNYQYAAVAASWEEGTSNLYIWKSAATVASPDNLFISFSYFTS